ncbi:copper resistance CopC family protein [Demequina aurantiaca]|uniref:copper resistance CopC family protein n=1 Tax=Demequina aurantiaca TaxID=676200 RepID=UPI003D352D4F
MNRVAFSPLRIASVALVSMLALALAPAASAHTSLISEVPTDGEVMTELADVSLVFSDELLDIGNSVTLTDAAGTTVDLEVDLSVPSELTAPLPADLAAGEYVIDWRVVASDGHPLENSVAFTYTPEGAASTPSASASEAAPAVASETPSPVPSLISEPVAEVSAVPISAPAEEGSSNLVWWIVGIGLVVGAVVGFVMWRTGTKKAEGSDAPQQ